MKKQWALAFQRNLGLRNGSIWLITTFLNRNKIPRGPVLSDRRTTKTIWLCFNVTSSVTNITLRWEKVTTGNMWMSFVMRWVTLPLMPITSSRCQGVQQMCHKKNLVIFNCLKSLLSKYLLGTSSKNKNGKMWEFLPSWGHPHPSPQFENFFPIFPFIVGMIDWRIFVCVIMILDPWSSSICWVFKALCLCLFYGLILVWYGRVRSVLKGWHQFGY